MRADENRETRRRSVWLPAMVLFSLLALDSAAIYWLTQTNAPIAANRPDANQRAQVPDPPPARPEMSNAEDEKATPPAPNVVPSSPTPKPDAKAATSADKAPAPQPAKPPPAERPTEAPENSVSTPPPPPATSMPEPGRQKGNDGTETSTQARLDLPKMPPPPPSAPLSRAPDPELVEKSPQGLLPIAGRDGREAWQVYARPFDQLERRPRIAVVLHGLGTSGAATRAAIRGLPGAITLAFSPYADGLNDWMADARASGHEILMMVPMEPRNYPDFDPGPRALLTSLTGSENADRLKWILGRGVGYVGVASFMGSRFTNSTQHMRALFQDLKKRGLLYLESLSGSRAISGEIAAAVKVPFAVSALFIDGKASGAAIDGQLTEAERIGRKLGDVVVMGFPYPVTLERVSKWAATVETRGFVLTPVSSIAKRRN